MRKTRTRDDAHDDVPLRAQVAESWQRSAAAGVQVDRVDTPVTIDPDLIHQRRAAHPLAAVYPLLEDVLGQAAADCDAVMALSDASGQLMWVTGSRSTLRAVQEIGFVEGSNWDERMAGTNAPGMVLALGQAASVLGAEHFRRSVKNWSCAAAPIHDPHSQNLLGVLDVTWRGDDSAVPQTLAMVRAAARMAESELARELRTQPSRSADSVQPGQRLRARLEVLGRHEALLSVDQGHGGPTRVSLSRRHSEIVLVLATSPRGMTGDELSLLLYEDDVTSSTLRAELSRLRQLLGDTLLASRPYRLLADVSGDWLTVESRLVAGDLAGAARAYRGPVLPRSVAPGVEMVRDQVHTSLREAILARGDANLLSWWTRSGWGRDDLPMWRAQQRVVDLRSPLAPMIRGQLARLDKELSR